MEIALSSYSRTVEWMHNFLSAKHQQWICEENCLIQTNLICGNQCTNPRLSLYPAAVAAANKIWGTSAHPSCVQTSKSTCQLVITEEETERLWQRFGAVRVSQVGLRRQQQELLPLWGGQTPHEHRDREMNDSACQVGGLVSQTMTCSDTISADFNCIIIVFKGNFWKNCPNVLTIYIPPTVS